MVYRGSASIEALLYTLHGDSFILVAAASALVEAIVEVEAVSKQVRPPNPLKVLREAIGRVILVKLKDGSEYIGRLELTDSTMNLVLSDCMEVKEGTNEPIVKYGQVLIRGSQILFISVDYDVHVQPK